jgi:hypothetical protein
MTFSNSWVCLEPSQHGTKTRAMLPRAKIQWLQWLLCILVCFSSQLNPHPVEKVNVMLGLYLKNRSRTSRFPP